MHDPQLAGTGRHLSHTELRAWTGFLDAGRMLEEILAAHLVDDHGMTHREYEVLVRLDGHGGRLRMATLATQMVASAPLITQTVGKLEQRGWVRRERADTDRRGIEAILTPAGSAALLDASAPHADLVRALLLDPMTPSELQTFADVMGRVATHLRNHRAGEPCIETCVLVRRS